MEERDIERTVGDDEEDRRSVGCVRETTKKSNFLSDLALFSETHPKTIWKKYSKLIITLISLIIISLISYQAYISWNKKKIEAISEQYFQALEELEDKN